MSIRCLTVLERGKGFETIERWTPEGDPNGEGKAAGPYRHGGMEPRYLLARGGKPDSHTIETYEADGGYETAQRVLTEMQPNDVVEQVKASGIRGRGGAGFPTGTSGASWPRPSRAISWSTPTSPSRAPSKTASSWSMTPTS